MILYYLHIHNNTPTHTHTQTHTDKHTEKPTQKKNKTINNSTIQKSSSSAISRLNINRINRCLILFVCGVYSGF